MMAGLLVPTVLEVSLGQRCVVVHLVVIVSAATALCRRRHRIGTAVAIVIRAVLRATMGSVARAVMIVTVSLVDVTGLWLLQPRRVSACSNQRERQCHRQRRHCHAFLGPHRETGLMERR